MAQKFGMDAQAQALVADACAMEEWATQAPCLHARHVESFERYVAERIREIQAVRDEVVIQTQHVLEDALAKVATETDRIWGITSVRKANFRE
ncbi:MAG: hypothetical protein M3Y28_01925 [Armatimonadota bacterium]|nr:hypothetical protein [Armatimonadota bacterium]